MKVLLEKPGTPQELVEHHGIKGMHWGIRKEKETSGQLKKISDKKESRAQKHDDNAKKAQAAINDLRSNPSKWRYIQNNRENQARQLEVYRDRQTKAAKDIREGHMTDKQKKILIGAGVAVGILAAYGTYKVADSGHLTQILNKKKSFKTNDLLSRKMSPDDIMNDVVKQINPDYGDLGTKMNCRRCTFAYEMRRRGMDVKATNSISGTGQHIFGLGNAINPEVDFPTSKLSLISKLGKETADMEKGGSVGPITKFLKSQESGGGLGNFPVTDPGFHFLTPQAKAHTVFENLSSFPDGARGELGVKWSMGGAHSMAWEIIGGQTHIFDTQTGRHYTVDKFADEIAPNLFEAGATRLDKLSLNNDFLKRWVQNVK